MKKQIQKSSIKPNTKQALIQPKLTNAIQAQPKPQPKQRMGYNFAHQPDRALEHLQSTTQSSVETFFGTKLLQQSLQFPNYFFSTPPHKILLTHNQTIIVHITDGELQQIQQYSLIAQQTVDSVSIEYCKKVCLEILTSSTVIIVAQTYQNNRFDIIQWDLNTGEKLTVSYHRQGYHRLQNVHVFVETGLFCVSEFVKVKQRYQGTGVDIPETLHLRYYKFPLQSNQDQPILQTHYRAQQQLIPLKLLSVKINQSSKVAWIGSEASKTYEVGIIVHEIDDKNESSWSCHMLNKNVIKQEKHYGLKISNLWEVGRSVLYICLKSEVSYSEIPKQFAMQIHILQQEQKYYHLVWSPAPSNNPSQDTIRPAKFTINCPHTLINLSNNNKSIICSPSSTYSYYLSAQEFSKMPQSYTYSNRSSIQCRLPVYYIDLQNERVLAIQQWKKQFEYISCNFLISSSFDPSIYMQCLSANRDYYNEKGKDSSFVVMKVQYLKHPIEQITTNFILNLIGENCDEDLLMQCVGMRGDWQLEKQIEIQKQNSKQKQKQIEMKKKMNDQTKSTKVEQKDQSEKHIQSEVKKQKPKITVKIEQSKEILKGKLNDKNKDNLKITKKK